MMSDTPPYAIPRETSINEYYFINVIKNDEKNINKEIFNEYFGHQNPSFLAKDLIETNQSKNKQIVQQFLDSFDELRSSIIKKEILENENPNK